jgi:hypothetical protein
MKYKYEVGGRVKISGKWWEIKEIGLVTKLPVVGTEKFVVPEFFIEACEPPEPKPFDWVPKHYNLLQARDGMTHHESINAWLTENYGDPTERVYNGEDASEFGLEPDSRILWFLEDNNTWADMSYYFLEKGDIWRKLPPVLTINKGE